MQTGARVSQLGPLYLPAVVSGATSSSSGTQAMPRNSCRRAVFGLLIPEGDRTLGATMAIDGTERLLGEHAVLLKAWRQQLADLESDRVRYVITRRDEDKIAVLRPR